MNPEALLQTMRAQRSVWVDLEPGKRVQVIRPREAEVAESFLKPSSRKGVGYTLSADLPEVRRFTVGWEGFTEADLIGAAGGSSPVPFHADVWSEVVTDRLDWSRIVAEKLVRLIADHQSAKAEAEKNSRPSSTPPKAKSTRAKNR